MLRGLTNHGYTSLKQGLGAHPPSISWLTLLLLGQCYAPGSKLSLLGMVIMSSHLSKEPLKWVYQPLLLVWWPSPILWKTTGFWTPAQVLFAQNNMPKPALSQISTKSTISCIWGVGEWLGDGGEILSKLGGIAPKIAPRNVYIWFGNLDYPPRTFRWKQKRFVDFFQWWLRHTPENSLSEVEASIQRPKVELVWCQCKFLKKWMSPSSYLKGSSNIDWHQCLIVLWHVGRD